jgi:hypothetical protein
MRPGWTRKEAPRLAGRARGRAGKAFVIGLLLAPAACGLKAMPVPLYPHPEQRRPAEDVATLQGPIASVDDERVARKGRTFELLPGCHVVELTRDLGEGSDSGAWAAHLPRIVYALRMRPAHTYVIAYQAENTSSMVGRLTIKAFERSPSGQTTRLSPAGSSTEIEACRRWATAHDDER